MARKVRDAALDSATARAALKPRGKPYWRLVDRGVHLGYRRLKGKAGSWSVRLYNGGGAYSVEPVRVANDAPPAVADDLGKADGRAVLDFHGAMAAARSHLADRGNSKPLTVRSVVEAYLASRATEGRDVRDARGRARAYIFPELGDKRASDLTSEDIEKWRNKVAISPPRVRSKVGSEQRHRRSFVPGDKEALRRRQSSANRVLTILRAALNFGFKKGWFASDAEWRKVERYRGVDAARLRYLSIAEAQHLVNATDADFRPMVQAALQTGARYGQLASLTVADFDPEASTLSLSTRKGDGTMRHYHCHLTEEGVTFFQQTCAGRAGFDLMFGNGAREWRASEQLRPMAAACKRAKIVPPLGFHALRHTWASLAVMGGTPLLVVAGNLGHTDTRMVEKHYGHLNREYVRTAINAGAPRFGT